MASLANQSISSTYDGLIKTSSDQPVPASGVQLLEDGVGNTLALSVGRANNGVTITGTVNAANLSVTGTILDSDGDAGTSGQVLSSTGTGTNWIDAGGGGTIDGSGTANYITKWLDTDTITDSVIYESSGKIGIGTTSPSNTLHVVSSSGYHTLDSVGGVSLIDFRTTGNTTQGGVAIGADAVNTLSFRTASTERMIIDSTGNVGIGTSSPDNNKLVIVDAVDVGVQLTKSGVVSGTVKAVSTGLAFGVDTSSGNTERMRIDSAGNVGIGKSPVGVFSGSGGLDAQGYVIARGALSAHQTDAAVINYTSNGMRLRAYGSTAGSGFMQFYTGGGGDSSDSERMRITSGGEIYIAGTTDRGAYNLQCNGTGVWGQGAYVNGSDIRFKEEIKPIVSGLDVVEKLKPVSYKYKKEFSRDTTTQAGFIAQDLQEALQGKEYLDGIVKSDSEYLSVAYQSLIPILTKAIQELRAEIETLKSQING